MAARDEHVFAELAPLFEEWVGSLGRLYGEYTDEQLDTIADFMHKAAERQREATERLTSAER